MPNEDCSGSFENDELICIAISDGVSSCTRSKTGAQTAVDTVLRLFGNCCSTLFALTDMQLSKTVCNEILYELNALAEADGGKVEDYSATVAFAVLQKKTDQLILFSLGDNAVVVFERHCCRIVEKPQKNSKETYTVTTRNGYSAAYVSRLPAESICKICLLTDGAWETAESILKNTDTDSLLAVGIEQSNSYDDSSFISLSLNP